MKKLTGIAVSPGIAIGKAYLKFQDNIVVAEKFSSADPNTEISRFVSALTTEIEDLNSFIDKYTRNEKDKELFHTHITILEDPLLLERISILIDQQNYTAEYALQKFLLELNVIFKKMNNKYLAERIVDYEDIVNRLIKRLSGDTSELIEEGLQNNDGMDRILVLKNVAPADVAKSYHSNVSAICLQKGSKTSHSAIIARALGLPIVVGVHDLFTAINNDDTVIVDGNLGIIIVSPDNDTLSKYESELTDEKVYLHELDKLKDLPSETSDKKLINLFCNVELEAEIDSVLKNKADGIGLFRTEYLYVDRDSLPTEEEQFSIYNNLARELSSRVLIIRTYDLGGDKLAKVIPAATELNPFLGCRGIRLSLKYPDIFKTQLKAILRANVAGNVSVMFPMVTSATDIISAVAVLDECKRELKEQKIDFNPDIPVGAMIEIPAAAMAVPELAQYCDFFSIGTNDLIQYTLAADRNSDLVSAYYDPYHPAVIKLILMAISSARRYGKPISVCGELASDSDFVCLLIGLGIDSLSVNPGSLLNVKKHVRNCSYELAKTFIKDILKARNSEEVRNIIKTHRNQ
jgi:phosphoenolpyruvate-protein phosphotransferase (PTS system enzyme I)